MPDFGTTVVFLILLKLITMADNKDNIGRPDRDRINLSEDYEVQDWKKKFGVSSQDLREAVKKVGNVAKDVEAYLKNGKKNKQG